MFFRWLIHPAVLCFLVSSLATAQNVITTIAGTEWLYPFGVSRALDAPLGGALWLNVAVDSQDNFYIADTDNRLVFKVNPAGDISVVAGNGILGYSGDGGSALNAALFLPQGVAVDQAGNIFIVEYDNRIRKVTPAGIISTIAGTGKAGFSGDNGPATAAALNHAQSIAADNAGNLYVADSGNNRIRKISTDGIITTIAGGGRATPEDPPGRATDAELANPLGVAVDAKGNVYIADTYNLAVRVVGPDGVIHTVAGGGFNDDEGIAALTALIFPSAVAPDGNGNVLIADLFGRRIAKVSPDGIITTFAGNHKSGFPADGVAPTSAPLNFPTGVAVGQSGDVIIADREISRIRKVRAGGTISTVAGNGQFRTSPDGGLATSAALYLPSALARDTGGNIYISEPSRNRVRKLTPAGTITTFAGTVQAGFSGDEGPASKAQLNYPYGVEVDAGGSVYISDSTNRRIRKVTPDGVIHTFAGDSLAFELNDGGPAIKAGLNGPRFLKFDRAGNLYISENAHRIRRISAAGIITTVAGTGKAGFSGDGGPATAARLNDPYGIAIDPDGNLFIADYENNRIRKVDRAGIITTVAGNGKDLYTGDGGPARLASLYHPDGITFGPDGNLYIADEGNNVVRMIDSNGIISTVAGTGRSGFKGDGDLATRATLSVTTDVAFDAAGQMLISDWGNHRVRAVLNSPASFDPIPEKLNFTAKSNGQPTSLQTIRLSGSVVGIPFFLFVPDRWLKASSFTGSMPSSVQIAVDPANLQPGTYSSTLTFNAAYAVPPVRTVAISLTVLPADPPKIAVRPAALNFTLVDGSGAATDSFTVSNAGGGSASFGVRTSTEWLSASPVEGTVNATGVVSIVVNANPAGLIVGTYSGTVMVVGVEPSGTVIVPVTMTISPVQRVITLSQTGLTFTAIAGGGASRQTVEISNGGRGLLNWTASVLTFSGGSNWLSVSPASGESVAGAGGGRQLEIVTDASRLAAGEYYGQVQVKSGAADNSPQSVLVLFRVLPVGSNPGPVVQPTGLIFTGGSGAISPGSQNVFVSNLSPAPVDFTSGRLTLDGRDWFVHLPTEANIATGGEQRIVVQPDTGGLAAGVYRGSLTLQFTGNITRTVSLALIVTPGDSKSLRTAAGDCIATKLVPVLTSIPDGFDSAVGWPTQIQTKVVDDCGNAMTSGNVISTFSNGDPAMLLTHSQGGNWSGTWQARRSGTSQVTISIRAEVPETKIQGFVEATGGLRVSQSVPVIDAGSLSIAAPGSLISIRGSHLADRSGNSNALPLETELNGTSVIVAGRLLPLVNVSDGRIDALIPFDVPVNTRQQMIVQRGATSGIPEFLTMAAAEPAVLTKEQSGQGMVYVGAALAEPGTPAKVGDTISIRCTGLGSVDPGQTAGTAAPGSPIPTVVNPVKVQVADVVITPDFAGLIPGSAGMYEVRAKLPAGVPVGDQVPLVLRSAGQASMPVTIAIQ